MDDAPWMASVTITRIAGGMYCVEHDGRNEIIYVAGPEADRWIFWKGQVFRGDFRAGEAPRGSEAVKRSGPTSLTAPMPARVIKILAQPGVMVKKGDTLVVLEAMKMELPIRAPTGAMVTAVHCREGELVDADEALLELGPP